MSGVLETITIVGLIVVLILVILGVGSFIVKEIYDCSELSREVKPHIVQFSDNEFGIRRWRWFRYEYLLEKSWVRFNPIRYTTKEEAKAKLKFLDERGVRVQ